VRNCHNWWQPASNQLHYCSPHVLA
jgi:hypothetical protein